MNKESYPNQRIYERDQFTCQYCGWSGGKGFSSWFVACLSIDHIMPQSAGGTNDDSNLVVACHACNLYKGSVVCESLEEAKAHVKMKQQQAEDWFNKHVLKKS